MLDRIVQHVAALTQCREVRRTIVARLMVEMGAGEHDIGHLRLGEQLGVANHDPLASVGAPATRRGIPPSSIA